MADGLNSSLANSILNNLTGNTTWSPNANLFAELHIGTPGAAGTSNPSGNTTRNQLTYNAAASGSITLSTTPTAWTNASGTETLSDIAYWNASSAGTFQWSAAMNSSHTWNLNDTFTLTSATVTITPLAA